MLHFKLEFSKYSPDQPRVPAGNPNGGQWTSGDDGGWDSGEGDPGSGGDPGAADPGAADNNSNPAADTSQSGDNQSGNSGLDVDKAIAYLDNNANEFSTHQCAKYVRMALKDGGIISQDWPKSAKDYDPYLEDYGFHRVIPTPSPDYSALPGDIVVIQPYVQQTEAGSVTKFPNGHIAMFNGSIWVSDYNQDGKDVYPGSNYRRYKPSYAVFRP